MSGYQFRSAECLADVDSVYAFSRDKEGRSDISCAYCGTQLQRVTRERARHWFSTHPCQVRYRPALTRSQRRALLSLAAVYRAEREKQRAEQVQRGHLFFSFFTPTQPSERPSGRQWRNIMEYPPDTRFFGGHRIGLRDPSPARLLYERHVDRLLAGIYEKEAGVVVPMPTRRHAPIAKAA